MRIICAHYLYQGFRMSYMYLCIISDFFSETLIAANSEGILKVTGCYPWCMLSQTGTIFSPEAPT